MRRALNGNARQRPTSGVIIIQGRFEDIPGIFGYGGQMTSTSTSRASAPSARRIRSSAHRQAVLVDLTSIVEFMAENLGPALVGLIAGVDAKTVRRWTNTPDRQIRQASEQRLRAAYQVFQELLPIEAAATIRAWFMGMNPQLGDQSPAEVLAQDQYRDVLAAARSFANGG